MLTFDQLTHFGGFDWASDHHDVFILDKDGRPAAEFRFGNDSSGWLKFREKIAAFPALAFGVETSSGCVVEHLLDCGVTLYPINPKSAERYRDRHKPSGVKDDRLDAFCLADALRVDGMHWNSLKPEDPLTLELRLLCRDEVALIEQRTALLLQLQAALREYFPAALEAFDDWTLPSAWAFLIAFPTPRKLVHAGKRKWEKFLHAHKLYRPGVQERRLEIFKRAADFCGSEATVAAKSMLAVTLAKMLQTLQVQLDGFRERIRELFGKHPDSGTFGSLPVGEGKLIPRIMSEIGSQRGRFDSAEGLQAYAGSAPVTQRSGKRSHVHMRRACNKHLRHALHLWADLSRHKCAWAQVYYQKFRDIGNRHADALRRLANRWLKIIWKMWQTRTPYDPELHQRNQLNHGSWVLQLAEIPHPNSKGA